jgi:hypothetical protein
MVFGDALIAAAIGAETFAKREVDIQTDSLLLSELIESFSDQNVPVSLSYVVFPKWYSWIGGIAGYRPIVFSDQVWG